MKVKFNSKTKSFSILHHYTNSEGAKSIMKEGFKNVNNQGGGISFFRRWDDVLRSDPRYNMHTVLENIHKRNDRLARINPKRWKWDWESRHRNDPDYKEKFRTRKVNDTYNYGWEFDHDDWGGNVMYKHGLPLSRYNEHDIRGKYEGMTDDEIYAVNPDIFDKEDNGIFRSDGQVTFPTGYKLAHQIKGIGRGEKGATGPVYRTVVSDVGLPLKRWTPYSQGFGYRVKPEDLDQNTRRIEIPRGMYDGSKKLKRGYINDYKDFKPDDYSAVDQPTREAVADIKKKVEFLGKGHGKRK